MPSKHQERLGREGAASPRWAIWAIVVVLGVGATIAGWRWLRAVPEGSAAAAETSDDVPLPGDWSLLPEPVRPQVREAAEHCRSHPNDPAAFERLARIYHGNEQASLAARGYARALELGSTDARTHYLLGLIHRQSGRTADAIERFEAAIALEPSYGPAHYSLGRSLLDAARVDEAVDALRRATDGDPDEPSFHAGLGRALRQAGRLDEAESPLRRALELDPEQAEAHQLLGLTLQARGETEAAVAHLERGRQASDDVVFDPWLLEVQQNATTLEILLDRASTHLDRGRVEGALELLSRAAALYPERAEAYRMLGRARARAGNRRQAMEAYNRALEIQPQDTAARTALAGILLESGKLGEAERAADLALAADPASPRARIVKASLAILRGGHEEAIEQIRPVLEQRNDLVAAHVVHGQALAGLGRLERAAAAFSRATELAPQSEYPRRRLGLIYRRLGRQEEALRELRIAAELDPTVEETARALADLKPR